MWGPGWCSRENTEFCVFPPHPCVFVYLVEAVPFWTGYWEYLSICYLSLLWIPGWWCGTWILFFSIQLGICFHPNLRSHIFQRGRSTTNQIISQWLPLFFSPTLQGLERRNPMSEQEKKLTACARCNTWWYTWDTSKERFFIGLVEGN